MCHKRHETTCISYSVFTFDKDIPLATSFASQNGIPYISIIIEKF